LKAKKILIGSLVAFLMMAAEGCVTAEKCREKFPESTNVVNTIIDTTIITSFRSFDTIVSVLSRDTIWIVDKETNVKVKVVKLPGDSIFVQPVCPPDTIVIQKIRQETTIERIRNIALENGQGLFWSFVGLLAFILVAAYFIQSIKK
jgi:hypothetical protein